MKNIILVAETGSDIPRDIAEELGIFLVPMHVTMGETTFDDGTFPVEKICEYYAKLDIENPIIRINTAFKGCSSLEKISVLPRIYHN